jgi:hypothetical protein
MTVIIRPDQSSEELSRVAQLLIAAADNVADVKLETFGDGPYFVVPDELAAKVDLNPAEEKTEPKASKKRKDS